MTERLKSKLSTQGWSAVLLPIKLILDAVSIGPNILEIHTPNEKLDIASTKRTWKFLIEILKELK